MLQPALGLHVAVDDSLLVRRREGVGHLAQIYSMVANEEAAIQQLDYLLARPSYISVTLLRLDPRWDPLRKNPKFEALLAKYEIKP